MLILLNRETLESSLVHKAGAGEVMMRVLPSSSVYGEALYRWTVLLGNLIRPIPLEIPALSIAP